MKNWGKVFPYRRESELKINDEIYGQFKIEGVLEELILSKPVQRLKGIHQGGASYLVNEKWDVTRYEHSIGVMLLIKKLGGSVEEQIAGLLHDISHTAFSHVVDFVFDNDREDYHEKIYEAVLLNSDVPDILTKHGYLDHQQIFDDSLWTILEQPAPDLCADRVDYTLRDMYHYGHITKQEVNFFLSNISIENGRMYTTSVPVAEWFVETYYKEVIDFFMDPLNIFGYDRLATVLKIALHKNIITKEHLLGTDDEVMKLLRKSNDIELKQWLSQLHSSVDVKKDTATYDIHHKGKVRLIDPLVLQNNEIVRASHVSDQVFKMGEEARKRAEEGVLVKIM